MMDSGIKMAKDKKKSYDIKNSKKIK